MTALAMLSPWSEGPPRRPAVASAWPLSGWSDATGTPRVPPTPNLCVVECRCADATAAAILADPTWGVAVLWCDGEYPPDEPSGGDRYSQIVGHFAAALGLSEQFIRGILGEGPGGRTRRQVAAQLAAWLRDRPPAE